MAKETTKKAAGKATDKKAKKRTDAEDEALAASADAEDSDAEALVEDPSNDDADVDAEADDHDADDEDESDDDEADADADDEAADDADADDEDVDDEDESDEDESDEDEEPEPVEPKARAKQEKKPSAKGKAGAAGAKQTKAPAKEPKVEPRKPAKKANEDYISDDIPDLFGLGRDNPEEVSDYEPESTVSVPVGAFIGLLIIVAVLVGGGWYALQLLDKRQAELDDKDRSAKAEAEASKVPDVRYGNVALLASTPSKALILQAGHPIYAKTTTGAWTELRTGPATRVQNIKIEEGASVNFTLLSEGYKAYELQIGEYDWVPIVGTGDWEKVYHNIRMDPEERPFLLNCQEVQALGPPYADICRATVTDEIMTRADFERLYAARITGKLTIESEPAGAKIFFLSKPLLQADGTQAVTPYEFSIHGKDDKGQDKPIFVTDELSVRLEKEGMEPYVTEIHGHQWHCEPNADPAVLKSKEKVIPEKLDAASPDLPHHLCRYTYKVSGKLFEPKPEAEAEKAGGASQP